MTEKEKAILLELIRKHLKGATTQQEDKKLINFYESFQDANDWANVEKGDKQALGDKMLRYIEKEIDKESTTIKRSKLVILNTKWWKYSAVASVVIGLGILSIFLLNKQGEDKESINTLTFAETRVEAGGDKAILTLENGDNVQLGKGKNYSTKTLKSNGEKIVYLSESDQNVDKTITYNMLTIPKGGQFVLNLSDSTKVWLNSDSKIKYPTRFEQGKDRVVELIYGEAYFDVSHSSKNGGTAFKVVNQLQEITVLGTEFNVKVYDDEPDIETTLVEGKVVAETDGNDIVLKPSQQLVFDKKKFTYAVNYVNTYDVMAWKTGVFSFNEITLDKIMKTLSRWYNVDIVFNNKRLEKESFSGVFRKNYSLNEILILMKQSNNIAYEIKDEIVYLK